MENKVLEIATLVQGILPDDWDYYVSCYGYPKGNYGCEIITPNKVKGMFYIDTTSSVISDNLNDYVVSETHKTMKFLGLYDG